MKKLSYLFAVVIIFSFPARAQEGYPVPVPEQAWSSTCTMDMIAGTYQSIAGDMMCEPGGNGLECCYGPSPDCRQMLHLTMGADGESLTGEWEHKDRRKGPIEFGLDKNCNITDGNWGFAKGKLTQLWIIKGRQ